ncbi:LAQU0S04e05006g1_1 [Lachancea quebecensis]|uniref:LAQU0S04e05006g1_1 n=1 Tax=Lachancea quebecensis TaxID=1654605 RepID=A0A0P1KQN5_9SACH|nr:LAQU0S04e05006g1_1 [Lachancea quebecensis]
MPSPCSCLPLRKCRLKTSISLTSLRAFSTDSSGEVGKELEHALNLSNEISKTSEEKLRPSQASESQRAVRTKNSGKAGFKYVKEVDRMLNRERGPTRSQGQRILEAANKILQRKEGSPKPLKAQFCVQPSAISFEPIKAAGGDGVKPPKLCHELDRVLFQPMNFHSLQDARSGTYNFSRWLENIIKVDDFDFEAVSEFVTASKDKKMLELTQDHNKRYYSSTSSMTGILSHMHFLISNFRKTNMSMISKYFAERSASFTWGAQLPAVVIMKRMKREKRIYSIDSDKSSDRELILSLLGHALETILTTEEKRFKQVYDKSSRIGTSARTPPAGSYHYAKIQDFVLRSQLDAYHDKLPGTGVFDLKTRAVAAVRHDIAYVEKNDNYTGYQIQQTLGKFESFERELFELIRSTMLKYSLQARIGCMDGIFVAYHNISKMFGFQYLPFEEMDHILHSSKCISFENVLEARNEAFKAIFGEEDFIVKHDYANFEREISSAIGENEFKISMSVLNHLLRLVESMLPDKFYSCRLVFKAEKKRVFDQSGNSRKVPVLNVIVAPLTEKQTNEFQNTDLRKEYLQDNAKIDGYIEKMRQLNEGTAKSLIGFEVFVEHEVQHHPDTIKHPRFADKKSVVLDEKGKRFVKEATQKNYYESVSEWKHVQFFHPLDILKWKPKFEVSQITNEDKLKRLYLAYLDDKLSALKGQSTSDKPPRASQDIISERIKNFMSGEDAKYKERGTTADKTEVSQLQTILRAYSKKGELAVKRSKQP